MCVCVCVVLCLDQCVSVLGISACVCVCELKMERKQRKWNVETEQLAVDRRSLATVLCFTSLYIPHPYPQLQAFYLESVSVLSPESWF